MAEEFNKQDTQLLDDRADKGKVEAQATKKAAAQSEEILPGDSFSADGAKGVDPGDTTWNGASAASSGGDWARRAMQLFPSERDFRHCVKGWVATIHPAPPFSEVEFERWHTYDAVPDSVTAELLPPPQVPEVRRDPRPTGDKDLDKRAATQTSNLSCVPPKKATQVCVSAPDLVKKAPEVELETRFVHVSGPVPDAKQEKQTVTPQQKKPTVTFEPVKRTNIPMPNPQPQDQAQVHPKPGPDRPTAAAAPLPPMSARIALADDKHIDGMREVYNEEVLKGTQERDRETVSFDGFRQLYKSSQESTLPSFVALSNNKDGEQVVGYVLVRPRHDVGFDGPADAFCAECTIFVRFKYRNRGIGQELLRRALARVTERPSTDSQPMPHFLYIEVACGSEDGLAEKKYIGTLSTKFGFEHFGRPVETVTWSDKGPYTLKHLLFYRRCTPAVDSVSIGAGNCTEIHSNGHTQQTKAQPATQTVGPMSFPVAGMKYNLHLGKESISRSRFHEQLLHDLVTVPATAQTKTAYTDYKNNNRVPANDNKAPVEFW